ncbi:MAG: 3-dehydroquinate synthase II [Candidatus Bathyarchaeia archaeon]
MKELWLILPPDIGFEEAEGMISKLSDICDGVIIESKLAIPCSQGFKASTIESDSGVAITYSVEDLEKSISEGRRTAYILELEAGVDVEYISRVIGGIDVASKLLEFILVRCRDWRVIPLENIVAMLKGRVKLLAEASTIDEALLLANVLEIGVDGLALKMSDLVSIAALRSMLKSMERLELKTARVSSVKPLGLGARVCIDTCELMKPGEGMLVGCQSNFLFLVEAEVWENPYVQPRPFRVNAGPIGLYAYAPGDKTKYLSELSAGSDVLVVDRNGRCRPVDVCRVKIEWRPLILIEAVCEGYIGKVILQNAETIRLITPDGSKSIAEIQPGNEVLVHIKPGARHLGRLVDSMRVVER